MCKLFQESVPLFAQKYLGKPDERVKNWFLLNSPLWLLIILFLHATAVLGGLSVMRNRKPMKLKNVLIIYNSFQVLYSAYICKEIAVSAYLANYSLYCTALDSSNNPLALRIATAFWYFYVSKIIDLADTVFFVLRKKKSQLTFLHCYHHVTMIFNWYLGVNYLPGGQAFFSAMLNSFVHIIMYAYYLLSAMGPNVQKYLWWKKYLTQIQLLQFLAVIMHIMTGYKNNCNAPKWLTIFTLAYICTLVLLFINFYIKTYNKHLNKKKLQKQKTIFTMTCYQPHYDNTQIDIKAGGDMKIE